MDCLLFMNWFVTDHQCGDSSEVEITATPGKCYVQTRKFGCDGDSTLSTPHRMITLYLQ